MGPPPRLKRAWGGFAAGATRAHVEVGGITITAEKTAGEVATGHATLKEIERYTKDAERKLLAISAMEKVKRGTSSG